MSEWRGGHGHFRYKLVCGDTDRRAFRRRPAASTNRKTVLKTINETPADLKALLQAWLLVAKHKARAYARALSAG